MIPENILQYLERHGVPFERKPHLRAITAQALASSLHVSGFQVAKSVILQADDALLICVVSAPDTVNLDRVASVTGTRNLRLADEAVFASRFPDCEVGAEPPFGGLYGLPVVVDEHLRDENLVLFRAGSHTEALELRYEDFMNLEAPYLGNIIHDRPSQSREDESAEEAPSPY
ncbi:YbaK/EbsC family protein [Myxococcus stipitatus]|uniref:aminoacyl-tRNA deacylase n=1 Tax=Myxococcus stipitatus TaxID=83455 RepID=UPI003144F2A5